MSNYIPDGDAVLAPPWTTVELAHRDNSLQIPINAVTHPAVSLSAACFGNEVYEREAAKRCISNLISVGFRRFYVDLYWAAESSRWSFCPVAIPSDAVGVSPVTVTSIPSATMLTGTLTAIDLPDSFTSEDSQETTSVLNPGRRRYPRASMSGQLEEASQTVAAAVEIPTTSADSGETLYNLGPYSCSHDLDISTLIHVFADYFETTSNTLEAHLFYLLFNVHAALSPDSPDKPPLAPKPGEMPLGSHSIGSIFGNSISSYLYGPVDLAENRANVDAWYDVDPQYIPVNEYFTTEKYGRRRPTTDNGWPCEGFVGLVKARRLLLGWGTVDPQMEGYDFNGDSEFIFSSAALSSFVGVKTADGSLESGCLYDEETRNVTDVDFSWAIAEIPDLNSIVELSNISRQFASCGISPLVNSTLLNVTADVDIEPYRNVSLSSVWSWSPGEPRNSSNSNIPTIDGRHLCATLDLDLAGQWRSTDCSNEYYAACRIDESPYDWNVTSGRVTYAEAVDACPPGSAFAVPRTGLENTYLFSSLQRKRESHLEDDHEIWMDINSLDVPTCWVENGPGAQCPYELDYDAIQRRTIIIPTIAAIVVLLITALTLFVKCNANRRNSRTKRVIEGWEYEGVPS